MCNDLIFKKAKPRGYLRYRSMRQFAIYKNLIEAPKRSEDATCEHILHDKRRYICCTLDMWFCMDHKPRKSCTAIKEGKGGKIRLHYKPVSRSSFRPVTEAPLRFLHRRCSGSKRGSCAGAVCSSLSISTLTITEDVASAPSSLLWGRNMAMTFETIPPAADPSGVPMGASASRSKLCGVRLRFQELVREWERDCERVRGERPTDMICTSVSSPSGVEHFGISSAATSARSIHGFLRTLNLSATERRILF